MLQLYRLTNTDIVTLENENKELDNRIAYLNNILNSDEVLRKVIIDQLKGIKKKYPMPRLSKIRDEVQEIKIDEKAMILSEDINVSITRDGYIKRISNRSIKASEGIPFGKKENDYLVSMYQANTLDHLLLFTDAGNYLFIPVHKIEEFKWKDAGKHVSYLVKLNAGEKIIGTILVKDFKKPQDLHKMTQLVACSVAGVLDRYGIKAKIKWPNDIYVDDLKICGILVEAIYQTDLEGVVVGVGLNVNSINGDYASMKMKTGQTYQVKSLMIAMLTYFKIYYSLYQQGSYDKILDYANDIAYLKDKQVEFQDYGLVTFTKLNENGTVNFVDSNHREHNILINEISLHKD